MGNNTQEAAVEPIEVVLVDDSPDFRGAVARRLAAVPKIALCAMSGSGEEALGLPASVEPDVVLLDLHLPDRFGIDLIGPLLAKWPRIKVIILTFDDYPRLQSAALEAGATAFVSKLNADDELVPAIFKAVAASEVTGSSG
jgi:DNA-binding NarL/FixJ family response regulator